jgi:hypothetical protein
MEINATNWQYTPFIFLYLLAIPIFWIIILYFYFHKDKEKVKVTRPIILYWRGAIGILFAAGIIYSILHILGVI